MRKQFECSICGKIHNHYTLVDFPIPDELEEAFLKYPKDEIVQEREVLYALARELCYIKTILKLPVSELGQSMKLLLWVKADFRDFASASSKFIRDNHTDVFFKGVVVSDIPFLKELENKTIRVYIGSLDSVLELPLSFLDVKMESPFLHDAFYDDYYEIVTKNITLNGFIKFQEGIYHPDIGSLRQ